LYGTAGGVPPLDTGKWHEYKTQYNLDYIENISTMYIITYTKYYGDKSWYNYTFSYDFPQTQYIVYDTYERKGQEKNITWEIEIID
jgi:hypothetical protein